jgi:hypothetical protein
MRRAWKMGRGDMSAVVGVAGSGGAAGDVSYPVEAGWVVALNAVLLEMVGYEPLSASAAAQEAAGVLKGIISAEASKRREAERALGEARRTADVYRRAALALAETLATVGHGLKDIESGAVEVMERETQVALRWFALLALDRPKAASEDDG